jgi:flagellar biosynthesis/type III secretory pathway protein FliH
VIRRARIVRAAAAARARPLLSPGPGEAQRSRIARQEVDARAAAEQVVAAAHREAADIVAAARAEAERRVEQARKALDEEADAKLAARWLLLRGEERRQLEQTGDRVIAIAIALAERLLDASLELAPEQIVSLARRVIAEAGGARRAVVEAHPLDADALRARLAEGAFDLEAVEVRESKALARGELRLHTDVGIIDARLAPRLHRLAAALRDVVE